MTASQCDFRFNTLRATVLSRYFVVSCVFNLLIAAQVLSQSQNPPPPVPTDARKDLTEKERVQLNKNHEFFKYVLDDAPFRLRNQEDLHPEQKRTGEEEEKAYNYVLAFARSQSLEDLNKYSTKGVPYGNLFGPIRADYLRDLIHVEGRLALILHMKPTKDLEALEGITDLYECWIFPPNSENPLVLVVSELPAGLEPGENLNHQVSFDAYFFKLFHYESRQKKAENSGKHQWRQAPLFLGKTFIDRGPIVVQSSYGDNMLATLAAAVALLIGLIGLLAWWLRRGDQAVRESNRQRLNADVNFVDEPESSRPVNRIQDY
jgi:hypothetical protein